MSAEAMGKVRQLLSILGIVAFSVFVQHWFVARHAPQTAFLRWFQENGYISPKVTLYSFEGYGNGLTTLFSAIANDEEILVIPSKLQISQAQSLDTISSLVPQAQAQELSRRVKHIFHSPLEEQDVYIALKLMLECSLGQTSFHHPYMAMLPERVPRLDTFHTDELQTLQDPQLKQLAEISFSQLKTIYNDSVRSVFRTAASSLGASPAESQSCGSFTSFHRFVGVASSHSMILDDGIKYLTPMADMINHAPRKEGEPWDNFLAYHKRNDDTGAIHVAADRAVPRESQVFEEYGQLDNSLYLLSFGFVPVDNPHTCAMVLPIYLRDISSPDLRRIMETLDIRKEPICVHRDGSLLEESDYLSLISLRHHPVQLQLCVDTVVSGDKQRMVAVCLAKQNHDRESFHKIIQDAASAVISASSTSLEEDRALLKKIEAKKDERVQRKLALQFRVEEKKVLHAIIHNKLL